MSAQESDDFKFLTATPTDVTFTSDGQAHIRTEINYTNMSHEEIQEAIGQMPGVVSDSVELHDKDGNITAPRRGRGSSVCFSSSRWKSSWDPKADPSLN